MHNQYSVRFDEDVATIIESEAKRDLRRPTELIRVLVTRALCGPHDEADDGEPYGGGYTEEAYQKALGTVPEGYVPESQAVNEFENELNSYDPNAVDDLMDYAKRNKKDIGRAFSDSVCMLLQEERINKENTVKFKEKRAAEEAAKKTEVNDG